MMNKRATAGAYIGQTESGWRLALQGGDSTRYRDAQLDDYARLPRRKFPHSTISLSLRARVSRHALPGTWGFGLWNDPFGFSLGFGGNPFRLPALPNAIWFFHASRENYLSFKSGQPQEVAPTNGFFAQTFKSPKFHPLLILAGLAFPFSRKTTRKLLGRVICEDGISLNVDVTEWHSYQLEWSQNRVVWQVDGARVYESNISPRPPLGIIIWMDNQYAAFTPEGKISAGVLANDESWLEVSAVGIYPTKL